MLKNKMPIQLDKILADIGEEKTLHPNYPNASKSDVDDAWLRVGKKNKLSVHEARSIFKVLQKKYEQEKTKNSTWKLFSIMEQIHRKDVVKEEDKEDDESEDQIEEDEEYEMLEVQEEEEHAVAIAAQSSNAAADDAECTPKSRKNNSSTESPENDIKPITKQLNDLAHISLPAEEKKLLNTMVATSPRPPLQGTAAQGATVTAASFQRKGITLKKTSTNSPIGVKNPNVASNSQIVKNSAVGKTIQLPESIKRKLSEEHPTTQQPKKQLLGPEPLLTTSTTKTVTGTHTASQPITSQLLQVKQERENQLTQSTAPQHNINLITIPANPSRADLTNGLLNSVGGGSSTAATVASTSTNGFSPRIEEIDFRNDIIFEANGATTANNKANANANASDIINLGNFDNSLPRTFFKNLCNSSRHEALGLYVANVMNRLRTRSAAKLELGILRAIIDVQSDELELQ